MVWTARQGAKRLILGGFGECLRRMLLRPILVADDSEDDVLSLRRMFAKWKVKNPVEVVPSGEEAIRYLKGEGAYADRERYPLPALFLLDLMMDGCGGLGVLEWMRKQPKPAFPIVVLTGIQDLREMRRAYQLGADSFQMKPLEEKEFMPLFTAFTEIEFEDVAHR